MKTVLTTIALIAVAALLGLSLLEWATDSGWVPNVFGDLFKIGGRVGLIAITLVGGCIYWIDRRRRND